MRGLRVFVFVLVVVAFIATMPPSAAGDVTTHDGGSTMCRLESITATLQSLVSETGRLSTSSLQHSHTSLTRTADEVVEALKPCSLPLRGGSGNSIVTNLTADLIVAADTGRSLFARYGLPQFAEALGWPPALMSSQLQLPDHDNSSSAVQQRVGVRRIPAVDFLLELYLSSRQLAVRNALLALLDAGGDPNLVSPWTADQPPALLQVLHAVPFDVRSRSSSS